jgi:hypothetical protein
MIHHTAKKTRDDTLFDLKFDLNTYRTYRGNTRLDPYP